VHENVACGTERQAGNPPCSLRLHILPNHWPRCPDALRILPLFVWDAANAAKNWHKHGVRFEEAATVFSDPFFRLVDAGRNAEARDAAIGFDATGRLLYVVRIEFAGSYICIVSARRAEPH
jgi:hypothetical protein